MNIKPVDVDFTKRNGLIPVVLQDGKTKDILMLAYSNREALDNTIRTGYAWFWSTSRNRLWMKGEESGNTQPVKEIRVDCDTNSGISPDIIKEIGIYLPNIRFVLCHHLQTARYP